MLIFDNLLISFILQFRRRIVITHYFCLIIYNIAW